ncbi:MAG: Peptidoglycan glycosyltransferase [Parcubacteria group bacterium GW2011_GWA2_42_35]|nr:MAG: Peptidoglycan glycosyltransferase [Parcubacteria group bacterium GW2011_GWC2_42_13]KKS58120.1 MAG: Peptidoglycan glycosyltransferase [Parcubacteria group bacterium GW2011_GWA2_42_35]
MRRKRKKIKGSLITLDEVFLDSRNMPGFDQERFEGRLEKPLGRASFLMSGVVFLIIGFLLFSRVFILEGVKGKTLALRAENNYFRKIPVLANRGVIYDRLNKELAWNEPAGRAYIDLPGLNILLGYVGKGSDSLAGFVGKQGLEKFYNLELRGKDGVEIQEINSKEDLISANVQTSAEDGKNLQLSVDAELQSVVYNIIKNTAETYGFEGGAAVMMDVDNGEIFVLTSYPEYQSQTLVKGEPIEEINSFLTNPQKPFLNRAVSGLYAPGSIIKPMIALAALEEKVITPEKQILSAGSISIPNPFFPDKKSVFYDWRAHGWVDLRRALAVSSDVYFYTIGGGFGDVQGLGINKINTYAKLFGFGSKTNIDLDNEEAGVVPSAEGKAFFDKDDPTWRVGDTYNASIGQGNFQITPVQAAVFAAVLANEGKILKPHLTDLAQENGTRRILASVSPENFQAVKEGMRIAVLEGTAAGLNGLGIEVAAKTGTSEIGSGKFVNSWLIGFFPYQKPKFAIAAVMEKGRATNLVGGVFVARQIIEWLVNYRPEYLEKT